MKKLIFVVAIICFTVAFCPPPPTETPTAEPEPIPEDVPIEPTVTAMDDTTAVASAVPTMPKPNHTAVGGALLLPETGEYQAGERLRVWPLVVIGLLVVAALVVVRRRVR